MEPPTEMWQDEVKAKLLDARAQWLEQHGGEDVAILSVTQLVQLLAGEQGAAVDEGRHIQCHDVSPQTSHVRRQSLKRPRADDTPDRPPPASAISFSSTRAWVTGFVRYEQATQGRPQRRATLCLCDATHRIQVHFTYPALELLNGLVLVKSWTVVRLEGEASSLVMEVHGDPVLLQQPLEQPRFSAEEAFEIVRAHYGTSDPPLYTGWRTWESVCREAHSPAPDARSSAKKRKVHTVIGHITSISPISVQEDESSSHFFVEIEDARHDRTRSIVNVLLAGPSSMKWYPFLWPGLLVLLTNLKKVYYSESEMFLLQASTVESGTEGNSSLFVWRATNEAPRPSTTPLDPLLDRQYHFVQGRTVNLEGIVSSVVWDDCVLLECEIPVLVALFHFPWSDMSHLLRVGSRIHIYQAHVLFTTSSGSQRRLVAGLCARSHIRIAAHAPATSEAIPHRPGDHRRRLYKKWSLFGDFGRQPLDITMWWLNLLEVLVKKFHFSSDSHSQCGIGSVSFTCTRRRAATLAVGQDIFSASTTRSVAARSLARRFLNTHIENDQDCPSISKDKLLSDFVNCNVLSLRNLESSIGFIARKRIEQAVSQGETVNWPIEIEPHELSGTIAVGALRGCHETSDLEIVDQTASLPVILEVVDTTAVIIDSGCALYAMKIFGANVETFAVKPHREAEDQQLVISLRVSICDIQRVSLCSSTFCALSSDEIKAATLHSVIVFVTHIGPWKRRRKMQMIVSEFRHIRGVAFKCTDGDKMQVNWDNPHCINLMMNTACDAWFLQKYSWVKFRGIRMSASSSTQEGDSDGELVKRWLRAHANSGTPLFGESNPAERQDENKAGTIEPTARRHAEASTTISYIMDSSGSVAPVAISPKRPSSRLAHEWRYTIVDEDVSKRLFALEELVTKSIIVSQVRDLFTVDQQDEDSEGPSVRGNRADPHKARLINLVGIVKERQLFIKAATPSNKITDSDREARGSCKNEGRTLMCRFKIRDVQSPESVFISVDTDTFGSMSNLQPGSIVEISMLQCFIARASFKPFLTWTHCTTVRSVTGMTHEILTDGRLFSEMPTAHLCALYNARRIDRTIKRFVVHLAHLSYTVIKRRCSQCKQPLTLLKRQQSWIHANALADDVKTGATQRSCSWQHISIGSPSFQEKTFLSCSLRGVIDDGSAQAELFLENAVVWELLRCSRGQRQRFEDLLMRQVSELSYFAARSPADTLFTSPSTQENLYYQNEWRAFVQGTAASLGAFVVFAQRFYKAPSANAVAPTAVLSFGKDIQITTPSTPLLPLEAVRVDELDPRYELRRRLGNVHGSGTGRGTPAEK